VEHGLGDTIARDSECYILEHSGACSVGFLKTIRIRGVVTHPVVVRTVVQVRSSQRFLNDSTVAVDFQETPLVSIQGPFAPPPLDAGH
jgi:hypothetical protein